MRESVIGFLLFFAMDLSATLEAAPGRSPECEISEMPAHATHSNFPLPYGAITRIDYEKPGNEFGSISAISPDGKWFAVAASKHQSCTVSLWNVSRQCRTAIFTIPAWTSISQLLFRTDNQQLAVLGFRKEEDKEGRQWSLASIHVIAVAKNQIIATLPEKKLLGCHVKLEHFDPEKGLLISLLEIKQTGIGYEEWDDSEHNAQEPAPVQRQRDPVLLWNPATDRSVKFYDKEEEFFVASAGRLLSLLGDRIRLIDPATRSVISEWERPGRAAFPFGVSTDGKKLIAIRPMKELIQSGTSRNFDQIVVCQTDKKPRILGETPKGIFDEVGGRRCALARLISSGYDIYTRDVMNVLSRPTTLHGILPSCKITLSADDRIIASGDEDVTLLETATASRIGKIPNCQGRLTAMAFSDDSRTFITVGTDGTAIIWDWAKACRLGVDQPSSSKKSWTQLSDSDARTAYAGMRTLMDSPNETTALLKEKPIDDAKEDPRLRIGQLNHDRYAVRERAMRELRNRGQTIQPLLEETSKRKQSPETEKRLQLLIAANDRGELSAAELQQLRAIQVLEWIDTAESRAILRTLAKGELPALRTTEATAALGRLSSRGVRKREQ